jgi:hypothetical protein
MDKRAAPVLLRLMRANHLIKRATSVTHKDDENP